MKKTIKNKPENSWISVCAALIIYYLGSIALKKFWPGFLYRTGLAGFSSRFLSLLRMTVLLLLVLAIMLLVRQSYIFMQKRIGFLKGLIPGCYILIFSFISILYNLFGTDYRMIPDKKLLLYYLFYFLLVGLIEEIFFRGIVADQILQIMLSQKKDGSSVIQAVLISSLVFSLFHLKNLSRAEITGVVIQMLGAFLIGMVLTAVYYRTRNIYVIIFLHMSNDIAGALPVLLGQNNNGISGLISSYGVLDVTLLLAYIPVLMVILRKEKTNEILQHK